jgi:hypothetical protein
MTIQLRRLFLCSRWLIIFATAGLLGACAHPIVINPLETPERDGNTLVEKNVAYVMTDSDRAKQVTSAGGGGDKVNYYPYRDLEKAIRDALRAVYLDVYVIRSPSDSSAVQEKDISYIFAPEISTSSNSDSMFTWPPTQFTIDLSCNVTDPLGNFISRIRVVGNGSAEFSEFKADFGLAGKRAASDLSEKLKQEIISNQRLH